MKRLFGRIFISGALLIYACFFTYSLVYTKITHGNQKFFLQNRLYVRVLIDERSIDQVILTKSFWSFSTQTSFIISDFDNPRHRQTLNTKNISLGIARNGRLTINGRRLLFDRIKIKSVGGPIKWGKYTYDGTFFVTKRENKCFLVNCIELEEYVKSGLRWEMVPGWPAATLEAGAIVYRTYVLHALLKKQSFKKLQENGQDNAHSNHLYDIGCTWLHQVYRGIHECQSICDAAEKTRGLVIVSDKKPILALYHACCGGNVPLKRANVDFNKCPYLARPYKCGYCTDFKCSSWKHSLSPANLSSALHTLISKSNRPQKNRQTNAIANIAIEKKDKSGAVQTISIQAGSQRIVISTNKLMELIKEIKSPTFTIVKKGKLISFEGKGFGHQLGLCQWGAYGLGKKGRKYNEILRFYYPKTAILNLNELI